MVRAELVSKLAKEQGSYLKTIKASLKIPVIMLSGKDSPQMVENAKNAGADAFLPKPFKDEDLKEKINTLLEG